jgi:hypothetical protein
MLKHIVFALSALAFGAAGSAKLPDPTPEQKAAAALAAAKTAHGGKVDAYKLCLVQTSVAEEYIKQQRAQGKAYTPEATAACVNPGPFVPPASTTPTGMTPAAPAPAAAPAQGGAAPVKK